MSEHVCDANGQCLACKSYGFCYECGCPECEPLPVVVAPSGMTDGIFILHFNARHGDAAGYLGKLEARTSWPDQIATYRAYHKKIHEAGPGDFLSREINHSHAKGTQPWQDPKETA